MITNNIVEEKEMYEIMQCKNCGLIDPEYNFEKHRIIEGGWAGCDLECPDCESDNIEIVDENKEVSK